VYLRRNLLFFAFKEYYVVLESVTFTPKVDKIVYPITVLGAETLDYSFLYNEAVPDKVRSLLLVMPEPLPLLICTQRLHG